MATFGYAEMRDWAEQSDDPRVKSMWGQLEECRSKNAQWCATVIRANADVDALRAEVERLREELQQTDNTLTCERSEWASEEAALEGEIAELEEGLRWIPVEEDLPELDTPVFLQQGKMVWIGCLNYCDDAEGTCWCNTYGHVSVNRDGVWECDVAEWDDDYQPTHWHPFPQPLPAPPVEEE